jgi:hypothetical protein
MMDVIGLFNPYGLIQKAGKKRKQNVSTRKTKTRKTKTRKTKTRKTKTRKTKTRK